MWVASSREWALKKPNALRCNRRCLGETEWVSVESYSSVVIGFHVAEKWSQSECVFSILSCSVLCALLCDVSVYCDVFFGSWLLPYTHTYTCRYIYRTEESNILRSCDFIYAKYLIWKIQLFLPFPISFKCMNYGNQFRAHWQEKWKQRANTHFDQRKEKRKEKTNERTNHTSQNSAVTTKHKQIANCNSCNNSNKYEKFSI